MPGYLLAGKYIFHLGERYPRKYASSDPQCNFLPLKLMNPVHSEMS